MNHAENALESGLGLFEELITEDAELETEFERSQEEFYGRTERSGEELILAQRRHLEWFLFDRPSPHLGGVPVEALQESWRRLAADRGMEERVVFLESICGAFEVTSCEAGRGLWASDLFGVGDYPVTEPTSDLEIEVGDVLVGRLFRFDDEMYRLSPAACAYRTPRLLAAVRRDLARMREGRRGVLRIEQLEVERLFFEPTGAFGGETAITGDSPEGNSAAAPGAALDLRAERDRARVALMEAGLSSSVSDEVLDGVSTAARGSHELSDRIVVEALNELAFTTEVDLEAARLALMELWAVERQVGNTPLQNGSAQGDDQEEDEPEDPDEVRRALEAFDRARAQGGDLDDIFGALAASLGVDHEPDDDEEEQPHEFPGVVGAMVEEFLWDVGREHGERAAEPRSILRRLSVYGQNIGVFENLSRRDLLDFAGRWILDEKQLRDASEVGPLVDALEEFCRWCEERHSLSLYESCGDLFPALRRELPRLLSLRAECTPHREDDQAWDVLEVRAEALDVRNVAGISRSVTVPAPLSEGLRTGDLVHARLEGSEFSITRCYPELLRELVDGS